MARFYSIENEKGETIDIDIDGVRVSRVSS
jgi:hypothetical protein